MFHCNKLPRALRLGARRPERPRQNALGRSLCDRESGCAYSFRGGGLGVRLVPTERREPLHLAHRFHSSRSVARTAILKSTTQCLAPRQNGVAETINALQLFDLRNVASFVIMKYHD